MIGLPYGTVLEVGKNELIPLKDGEDLLPGADAVADAAMAASASSHNEEEDRQTSTTFDSLLRSSSNNNDDGSKNAQLNTTSTDATKHITKNDNRNINDSNTSQSLTQKHVESLVSTQTPGSHIVAALISNSSTFASKTAFSQAKYINRKQMKYQPRCRIVRVTPESLCSAMHLKDARKISNLRPDTLGCILTFSNICAGQRVMVMDTAVQGIITASATRKLGGYGSVIGLFSGQQPSYLDVVNRMNFTLLEKQSLKWVNLGEVFADYDEKEKQTHELCDKETGERLDVEKRERERVGWPAPLLAHTRNYLETEVKGKRKIEEFLNKRSARFARKLTRNSMLELRELVDSCRAKDENYASGTIDIGSTIKEEHQRIEAMDTSEHNNGTETRQCDSLIIATKYDPTASILRLLPYLAPSCPFVIYHEFLEPLLETFRTLQHFSSSPSTADESGCGDKDDEGSPMPMMCRRNIAINLRLTDTWFREYQVLEGRTHPNMTMSQNGGYLLMGTKLCPKTGTNEMDEETLQKLRANMGPRRSGNKKGGGEKRKGEDDVGKAEDAKKAKA